MIEKNVSVSFTADEPWTTITCADGSVLRIRTVVKDVVRTSVYDEQGNPTYKVEWQTVYHVVTPPELKRDALGTGSVN